MTKHEEQKEKKITIHIDRDIYHVDEETMTGLQLKQLGGVQDDHDLWQVVPGQADDIKIDDSQVVELSNGMKFISALKELNPGGE